MLKLTEMLWHKFGIKNIKKFLKFQFIQMILNNFKNSKF